jgi:hypothetical protein
MSDPRMSPIDLFKLRLSHRQYEGNPKIWFVLETDHQASEYNVIAYEAVTDGADIKTERRGEVIKAPTLPLALEAMALADRIVTDQCDDPAAEWNEILKKMYAVGFLSHPEASARRYPKVQRAILDSFVVEPLVKFGRFACRRRNVESFEIVIEQQTAIIYCKHYNGSPPATSTLHVCFAIQKGLVKQAEVVMDQFLTLLHQQYIDPELARQFDVKTPLTPAEIAANAAAKGEKKKEEQKEEEEEDVDDEEDDDEQDDAPDSRDKNKKRNRRQDDDDEDEDRDDKVKQTPPAPAVKVEEEGEQATGLKLSFVPPLEKSPDDDDDEDVPGAQKKLEKLTIIGVPEGDGSVPVDKKDVVAEPVATEVVSVLGVGIKTVSSVQE